MADFAQYVSDGFAALTPDLTGIYNDAIEYNVTQWQTLQSSLVTATGAAAIAIPGLHLLTIAADVAVLMNRMSVCSYGIGAIIGNGEGHGFILEEEDFPVILGRWCKVEGLDNAALSKAAAEVGIKVGGKIGGKVGGKVITKEIAKFAVKQASILIGKKLAGPIGAKLGSKFGAKLGGKVAAGFIPFLGPAIGGSINLYFITEISREAKEWYNFKVHGK